MFKTARGIAALRKADTVGSKEFAKAALANLFADARGVTMKIGQLFSELEDGSPFDQLAKGVDPYPFSTMLPVLEDGLGRPVSEVFADIEDHAIAASLGQVHKARLLNGDVVAVKIRYPGIASAVDAEMKIAGLIPSVGPAKKWGMDLTGYKQVLKANMDRELDYRTEAQRQIAYRDAWHKSVVYTPQMVVQGRHDVMGSRADDLAAVIAAAQRTEPPIKVTIERQGGMLKCRIEPGAVRTVGIVWIAKYTMSATVEIDRGENAGRTITYVNVVNSLQRIGSWAGTEPEEVTMPQPEPGEGVAIWIQAGEAGPILAAAKIENPLVE